MKGYHSVDSKADLVNVTVGPVPPLCLPQTAHAWEKITHSRRPGTCLIHGTKWIVKAMVFPVVRYRYESWTIKKVECQRIYGFELWCWRRLLRAPWTARRSNQSILKEINMSIRQKGWCGSWNSNTLATWCEELIHWKRPWCWKRLMAVEQWGKKECDGWKVPPTQWTRVWANSGRS